MRNENDALEFPRQEQAAAVAVAGGETLTWYTPVRFDPGLLRKLLDQHTALGQHVASLPSRFGRDREDALKAAYACAGKLHELRRQEALWIYPVMSRTFAGDPVSRRQLLNLRFVMNGLARRVLRSIDELTRAMRLAADVATAAANVTAALAEYRQRNESELYTLYSLMDPRNSRNAATLRPQAG